MTNGQDFDEVLNVCLDRLQQGDTVEACLVSYPVFAGRLAPMLQMAELLHVPDGPTMSGRGFNAGKARMLQRAARLRAEQRVAWPMERESPLRHLLAGTRRLLVAAIAGMVLFCLVLGAGAVSVSAASNSLPGSPLYSVKRATENLLSSAAFTPRLKARAHLAWAERRLGEIGALIARDGVVYRTLLASLQNETERALDAAREAGIDMLTEVVALTEREQVMLAEFRDQSPELYRADLEQAVAAAAALQEQAQAALSGRVPARPTFASVPSATFVLPGPTPTSGPSEAVEGPETATPAGVPGSVEPTMSPPEPVAPTATLALPAVVSTPGPFETLTATPTPAERLTVTSQPAGTPTSVPAVVPVSPVQPTPTHTATPTQSAIPTESPTLVETPTERVIPAETPTLTEAPTSVPTEMLSSTATPEFDDWDRSSLAFVDQGARCEGEGIVWAMVRDNGETMTGPTGWELWYADSGNPKSGTRKATGTIPALDAGQEYAIYTASQGSGNYMFKAYQRPGHPGTGVLWSKAIEFDIGACSN